ncbi:MAG: hypothetical protein ABS873_03200 [Alkalibacterium sp.]
MIREASKNKGFPKGAMTLFIVVLMGVAVYEMLTLDAGLSAREDTGILIVGGLVGSVGGIIGALIGLSIQYAFIKFPTQWLSKEEFVYKNEIWEAIFYSSAIGYVLNFILRLLDLQTNLLTSSIVSVITAGLFLSFYFSGREKEVHIKRAITIVQIIWIVLGVGLGIVLNVLFADVIV